MELTAGIAEIAVEETKKAEERQAQKDREEEARARAKRRRKLAERKEELDHLKEQQRSDGKAISRNLVAHSDNHSGPTPKPLHPKPVRTPFHPKTGQLIAKTQPQQSRIVNAANTGFSPPKPVIAVLNMELSDSLSHIEPYTLTSYLILLLARDSSLSIIAKGQSKRTIQSIKRDNLSLKVEEENRETIGRTKAVERVVIPNIITMEDQCLLGATIYDIATETSVGAASVASFCDTDALLKASETLSTELLRYL